MEGGLTFEDCRHVCKMLQDTGVTAIEISGGIPSARVNEGTIRKITPETESYFKQYAAQIAEEIDIPVILVGGNRDFIKTEEVIAKTNIEYISLCRPFIREPELVNRWLSGDRTPAKCISCSKCFGKETNCIFNN
jgi:2,4-dienoyl-CoA reductase-like NADH-dependent reductase (Old Yellow Enzyme family)